MTKVAAATAREKAVVETEAATAAVVRVPRTQECQPLSGLQTATRHQAVKAAPPALLGELSRAVLLLPAQLLD